MKLVSVPRAVGSRAARFLLLASIALMPALSQGLAVALEGGETVAVDPTNLPLGDGRTSRAPQLGALWTCQTSFNGSGAFRNGPWIHTDGTYDSTRKAIVSGEVEWAPELSIEVQGSTRVIRGNGLPNHPTGIFPILAREEAYQYDRNPNQISPQNLRLQFPANPQVAAAPSCVGGTVGFLLSGGSLFDGFDAGGRDAVAYESQDACGGHPEVTGAYHYHAVSPCIEDPGSGHSVLTGYALDGFGIYGNRGESGESLTNRDLDECHGHTHLIDWDGEQVEMFHYHATAEFPYSVGCYRGAHTESGPPQGGPPPGGSPQGPQSQRPGGPPPFGGPPPPPRR